MSTIGRLAVMPIAAALAAGWSGAARAADTALCTYLKAVIAARPGDFADLKGAPDTRVDDHYYRFHGRLQSSPGDDCTTSPRHYTHDVGVAVAPPYYDCVIATESDYAAAEADYGAALADIKTCLPAWRFSDKRDGEPLARTEGWTLVGEAPHLRLRMQFFDYDLMHAKAAPDIRLTVSMTIVGPAPKGATIFDAKP